MGLTKNLGWLSKYITAESNGNISLSSDSGLGFQLLSATDNTRGLYMGYNYSGNYARIEAVHQNVGYKNIVVNPSGGSLLVGGTNDIAGGAIQALSSSGTMITTRTTVAGNAQPGIRFYHDGNDEFVIRGGSSLRFLGSGVNERVRITSGGEVGIGTISPDAGSKLTINGTGFSQVRLRSNDTDRGYLYVDGNEFAIGTTSGIPLNLQINGSNKITITTGGNVLIGAPSDNGYKLNVNGSSSVSGTARASNFSPYNFVGVTAGSPSSATIPLGYSSMSIASLCDGQWRVLLNNLNDVKAFCWVTMGDAASKDTASYQMGFTNPSYGVNAMSAISYSDNGWNTGSFALTWDGGGGNIRLLINTTSYYSSGNYAYGVIHFLRLE